MDGVEALTLRAERLRSRGVISSFVESVESHAQSNTKILKNQFYNFSGITIFSAKKNIAILENRESFVECIRYSKHDFLPSFFLFFLFDFFETKNDHNAFF